MEGISDIQIVGIDEKRPPRIRKEPYIDLYFRLSHKAPGDWCKGFNALLAKHAYTSRINADEGLYIETWVRSIDEVTNHFNTLKETVALCTTQYIEKINRSAQMRATENGLLKEEEGEQGRLNRIIAGLDFSV